MTRFFAKFEPDGDGFLVTFPEIPEAITGGATHEEALANAQDALEIALLTYATDKKDPPRPSTSTGVPVTISAAVAVKIAFITAFLASGLTRVTLAEKLSKQETEIRRMLDPFHATKLASMEAALAVLGKQLVVSVQDAA